MKYNNIAKKINDRIGQFNDEPIAQIDRYHFENSHWGILTASRYAAAKTPATEKSLFKKLEYEKKNNFDPVPYFLEPPYRDPRGYGHYWEEILIENLPDVEHNTKLFKKTAEGVEIGATPDGIRKDGTLIEVKSFQHLPDEKEIDKVKQQVLFQLFVCEKEKGEIIFFFPFAKQEKDMFQTYQVKLNAAEKKKIKEYLVENKKGDKK